MANETHITSDGIRSERETIQFRFTGGDVAPSNVRASDVADLVKAADMFVSATVAAAHDEMRQEDVIVGITEIRDTSLGLIFTPALPRIVLPVFERAATAVQRGDFYQLPEEARDAVRKVATFARKNRCRAELRIGDQGVILATIDETVVVPIAPRIAVQTTFYGRVINAGGRNPPNVHVETLDRQQIIICKGDLSQIKTLASRLYTVVGLSGTARCDVDTLAISDFEITEILPYEETSIEDALSDLAALAAPYFEGVDADAYVRSLRDDDSEG